MEPPIPIRSPCRSSRSVTGTLLTNVPLWLFRSAIVNPSATRVMMQCRRESSMSEMWIPLEGSRPTVSESRSSGMVFPSRGPAIAASAGVVFDVAIVRRIYPTLATYPDG